MRPVLFYNNRAHPTSSRLAAAAVRPQMIIFNFLIRYNYYNTYISDVNLFPHIFLVYFLYILCYYTFNISPVLYMQER